MRAAVVEAVGSLPTATDAPDAARENGTAVVAVAAAPLNPVEIRVAAGRHPRPAEPPYIPGLEGAGTVVESTRMARGTRVRFEAAALPGFGAQGTLGEQAAVPEESLVELPDPIADDVAAALGVVGVTALLALERAAPAGGERVLVLGATGALGQIGVQLAKLMGADRVVGAGRSPERLERVRELGADAVVELGGEGLADAFEDAAGGPLDIVIDSLWGEPAMEALRALATEGRLVNVGQPAGTDVRVPVDLVRNRQGSIHAISSGWTGFDRKALAYRRLLHHAAEGRLSVDREVVPLDDVASAWRRQEESPGRKLVIALGPGR